MILFFDGNTVWRRKYAEALARAHPATLIVSPQARLSAAEEPQGRKNDLRVLVPPGWASRLSRAAMPYLLARCRIHARRSHSPIDAAFLTSPHYLRLARALSNRAKVFYYCSDDYRTYRGWGGPEMIEKERTLCRLATGSIFVSEALRRRAVDEYGLDPARTHVSPNATEPRFGAAPADGQTALATLPRPIFGAVGMFNDRIDFDFLDRIAAARGVGSLALVGPMSGVSLQREALDRLLARPNVFAFGAQPHASIHHWMAGLDVAVIPYAATPLNHFCSPMRLYDHLAIGHPILATPNCAQLAERRDILVAGDDVGFAVEAAIAAAGRPRRPVVETWDDRVDQLAGSLEDMEAQCASS